MRLLPIAVLFMGLAIFARAVHTILQLTPVGYSYHAVAAIEPTPQSTNDHEKPQEEVHSSEQIPADSEEKKEPKKDQEANNTQAVNLDQLKFTDNELKVLKNLKERHKKLLEMEEKIILKRNIDKAIEHSIDNKLKNLEILQQSVSSVMQQYQAKQDENIMNLTKVYENMKPKDAAKIFDSIQLDILLEVTSRMKDSKLSAILSLMDSDKARDLTIAMMNYRKIPDEIRNPKLPVEFRQSN